MSSDIYSIPVRTIAGEETSLEKYRGKVLLVVNVASECGFTPQYEGLEALHRQYGERGLVVLGFPCDQFGGQEPGSEKQIQEFCTGRFGVTFPMFSKVEVNGKNAHPLFERLKSEGPGILGTEGIKWNFTKFLLDREGRVIQRFAPTTEPKAIAPEVERLL